MSKPKVKEPYNLSPRIRWLYDYYFAGAKRKWNNEFNAFTTGTEWDVLFDESSFYIVPEVYSFFNTFNVSFNQAAVVIDTDKDFYKQSLVERRAWFVKEAIVKHLPKEILPGDLIAGGRFNLQASRCLSKQEAAKRKKEIAGKNGLRNRVFEFHDRGFGNCGATCGHLIPDYPTILEQGFEGIYLDLEAKYAALTPEEKEGAKGAQLRAMMTAATLPRDLAHAYADMIDELLKTEADQKRRAELETMRDNLRLVPWKPAQDFWQAMQALWLTHMLVLSDENYPGAGVSFGRLDQYMLPYYQRSLAAGMDREFCKEILKCFWLHCNYAYDAMIATGDQGITAGYGQLFNLSGMGRDGKDATNELTWALLEVIDEMSPILEPKPNVRLHANTPDALLDKVVDMISASQGAPFLLNFDERSMAGMLREAKKARVTEYINEENVCDYASVGCLENTMCGNDRSHTVDCNLNLFKAVELALGNGRDIIAYTDALWGKQYKVKEFGPATGDATNFTDFEEFYAAFKTQLRYSMDKMAAIYNRSSDNIATYAPTPYLSCLVRGCAEKAADVTANGPELRFVTVEGVTYATTVDSLLAIKYLVFDKKECSMAELIEALKANWEGHEILRAKAINRAPKYGRDDPEADKLAQRVMEDFSEMCWDYKTNLTDAQYRPGMLSWNYWIGSGYILPASPDGRCRGQFLSNAICPVNGADTNGPTANSNSVGTALGGKKSEGDFQQWINYLPNGASHTITLSPSLIRDDEHKEKLKAFLRGYVQNGGTALQINILDPEMLRDAQKHPEDYRNLLVRVTGYNAYFTSIGRELQNEIIARESHGNF